MRSRFPFLAAALLLAGTMGAAPAPAQTPQIRPPAGDASPPDGSAKEAPATPRSAEQNLDRLFAALKVAPTPESAKFIEGKIWAAWAAAGGDTATLLMTRVRVALEGKETALALKLLTAIIDIKPDYIEAWNRRATLNFLKKDYAAALADLRAVLAYEPRHFGAWAGLGMILNELGEEKRALTAFRRALELHPHLEKIPDMVTRLTETVEGRDI